MAAFVVTPRSVVMLCALGAVLGCEEVVDHGGHGRWPGHPRLLLTAEPGDASVAQMRAQLAPGGALHSQFQAFVDVFCRPAPDGMLDTYLTDAWPAEEGLITYGFLIATYPVQGIDYRAVKSLDDLDVPFLAMWDSVTATPAYDTMTAERLWGLSTQLTSVGYLT